MRQHCNMRTHTAATMHIALHAPHCLHRDSHVHARSCYVRHHNDKTPLKRRALSRARARAMTAVLIMASVSIASSQVCVCHLHMCLHMAWQLAALAHACTIHVFPHAALVCVHILSHCVTAMLTSVQLCRPQAVLRRMHARRRVDCACPMTVSMSTNITRLRTPQSMQPTTKQHQSNSCS